MNVTPGQDVTKPGNYEHDVSENMDEKTAAQVKAARSRSNSWFSQVKLREARLQAAEDKALQKEEAKKEAAEAKKEARDGRKSSFFGSTLRRLSSGGSKRERRDSNSSSLYTTVSGSSATAQNARVTLNKNTKRKRTNLPGIQGTNLRRVCFQLDELVELRTYDQVEAETVDPRRSTRDDAYPTVKDMTVIDPYASSTPLDRADLYLQCCKVYKIAPTPEIEQQLRARGPSSANHEGPRTIELRNISLTFQSAVAFADCLGLPLTGKHLIHVTLDNCGLDDATLQLLLSCLYTSASLERLDIINNPSVTAHGLRCALCFLCLSPQLQRFNWQGPQLDGAGAKLIRDILASSRVRALTELGLNSCALNDQEFTQLLTTARQAGVRGFGLKDMKLSSSALQLLGSMLAPAGGLKYLDVSENALATSFTNLLPSFTQESPLISLDIANCGLDTKEISQLILALSRLPNFRRLNLAGHNLQPLVQELHDNLPRLRLLRRLGLSNTGLSSQDIVILSETLAELRISELLLTGIELDNAALSALYALARISKTLVNLEMDIPEDTHSEKLGRRILAECIRNMETQEASLGLIETDEQTPISRLTEQHPRDTTAIDKHQDLHDGAHGVASALDQYLDLTDEDTAKDVPLAMLERARHIRIDIEPALAEPLSELQSRRLTLVAETLDKVIRRFEEAYPDCKQSSGQSRSAADAEIYEHTGRSRASFIPARNFSERGAKSRELEAEEGEMMKLAHRMTDRLSVLRSASVSASPSNTPSRDELADQEEVDMLERLSLADGTVLKQKLYDLQQQTFQRDQTLGRALS